MKARLPPPKAGYFQRWLDGVWTKVKNIYKEMKHSVHSIYSMWPPIKNLSRGAGEMAQCLWARSAFAEGLSSTVSTYLGKLTTACKSSCRGSTGICTHMHIPVHEHSCLGIINRILPTAFSPPCIWGHSDTQLSKSHVGSPNYPFIGFAPSAPRLLSGKFCPVLQRTVRRTGRHEATLFFKPWLLPFSNV